MIKIETRIKNDDKQIGQVIGEGGDINSLASLYMAHNRKMNQVIDALEKKFHEQV